MNPRVLLRAIRLDGKAIASQVGLAPMVGGLLVCAAAMLQEPAFFRLQQLDLAWPFVFGVADIIALICCVAAAPIESTTMALAVARATACLAVAFAAMLVLAAAACAFDFAVRAATPWRALPILAVRFVLCWLPIAVLSQVPVVRDRAPVLRFLILVAAYLVQSGVHPASLHVGFADPTQFLASLLAATGGLIALARPTS
jgi:hypothetical protein